MQLKADLDPNFHAHIIGLLRCSQFEHPKFVHFVVDTGCSITTLLGDDVTRLSINCHGLQQTDCNTANGMIRSYLLPQVDIILPIQHGLFGQQVRLTSFHLENAQCNPPTPPQPTATLIPMQTVSLLGMDILRFFKNWKYTRNKLIMKT